MRSISSAAQVQHTAGEANLPNSVTIGVSYKDRPLHPLALDFHALCFLGHLDAAAFCSHPSSAREIINLTMGDVGIIRSSSLTVGMRKPCLAKACDIGVGSSIPGNFFADITSNGGV